MRSPSSLRSRPARHRSPGANKERAPIHSERVALSFVLPASLVNEMKQDAGRRGLSVVAYLAAAISMAGERGHEVVARVRLIERTHHMRFLAGGRSRSNAKMDAPDAREEG